MVRATDVCDTSKALGVFGEIATIGFGIGVGFLAHKVVQSHFRGTFSPEVELLVGPLFTALTVAGKHIVSDHLVLSDKTVEPNGGGGGTAKKVKGFVMDDKKDDGDYCG